MTKGSESECKCPSCKKVIFRPIGDNRPQGSTSLEGVINCPHCACKLYFWAYNAVSVQLELESRVK